MTEKSKTQTKKSTCEVCGDSSFSSRKKAEHFRKYHPEYAFYIRHITTGKNGKSQIHYHCKKCGARPKQFSELVVHYEKEHFNLEPKIVHYIDEAKTVQTETGVPRVCPICKTRTERFGMADHFKEYHPEYDFVYEERDGFKRKHYYCTLCGTMIGGFGHLVGHYRQYHLNNSKTLKPIPQKSEEIEQQHPTNFLKSLNALCDEIIMLRAEKEKDEGKYKGLYEASEIENRALKGQLKSYQDTENRVIALANNQVKRETEERGD